MIGDEVKRVRELMKTEFHSLYYQYEYQREQLLEGFNDKRRLTERLSEAELRLSEMAAYVKELDRDMMQEALAVDDIDE